MHRVFSPLRSRQPSAPFSLPFRSVLVGFSLGGGVFQLQYKGTKKI